MKAALPVISIVTPCLNAASHIERCLESVRDQGSREIEHIVIDGGSTDQTMDIVRAAPGVQWVSEPDGGQSDAINKGFALARGQVLTWLNADDALVPGAVGRVLHEFRRDAALQWITGRSIVRRGDRSTVEPAFRIEPADLQFGNPVVQPSTFFTRAALDQAGGVDASLHYAMDLDLWLTFIELDLGFIFLREILSDVIYDADSKTGGMHPSFFFKEEFLVYRRHLRPQAALLALGRVAAYSTGMTAASAAALDAAAEEAAEWARTQAAEVNAEELAAVARMEAFFREMHLQRAPMAVRHLFHRAPWIEPACRRRILQGLRRKALAPIYRRILKARTPRTDRARP